MWLRLAFVVGLGFGGVSSGCADGTCEGKIAAMRATLETVPADAGTSANDMLAVGAATALPEATKGEPVRGRAPLLRVDEGGAQIEGAAVDPLGVAASVSAAVDRLGADRALYVALAPGVRVPQWLMAVPAEVQLRVLVRTPAPTGPRTASGEAALARVRAATEPMARVTALVDELHAVAAGCKQLQEGFQSLASAPAERKQGLLTNLAIDSATACGCEKVDVDRLSALIFYMLMGDDPGLRWLPLRLEVGASRLVPGDATGQELARILETESRLGFAPH